MRPIQATFFKGGARSGLRWHPSGKTISVVSDRGVAAVCVEPGPLFGKSCFLTPHGAAQPNADAVAWSNSGKMIAFNRPVPTRNDQGVIAKDATGRDFLQVFVADFPDANNNGIADPIESGRQ